MAEEKKCKKCKECKFAHFEKDPKVPGSYSWQGRCYADILSNDNESKPFKYHSIMQHFRCSNNKFEKR